MAQCACSNEAVDGGSHCQSLPPGRPAQSYGFFENRAAERRFNYRKREHRLASYAKGPFVASALQDFLDYGQAGNYLIEVNDLFQAQWSAAAEDFNPDRGVKEDHRARRAILRLDLP
jgi:hypothetical protein